MDNARIIRTPLVTEKNTFSSTEFNRYGFEVDPQATKPQIRAAVQEMYKVRVLSVATQNRKGHTKRNKFGAYEVGGKKIAIVKIHPDDKIELF
ncbi:MAG TPA: 50S ribosomal protein L23 [Phycisphaerales bacterium]|nr:50S ribosomal protein L23 [Phycisphaerales bacterium]